MKMTDILEKDKDRLLTELASAKTAEKAVKVLENETDKLVLRYNEQCDSERARDTAAHIMQAVRLALSLTDSTGNTRVWESGPEAESERKVSIPSIILLILGVALCVFGLLPFVLNTLADMPPEARNEVYTHGGAVVAGIVLLFVSGLLFRRQAPASRKDQHVEVYIDPAKVYRNFRTIILSADQSLEEVLAAERWSQREQAGNIDGRPATTPEIELFSDLLAAAYSGDPEYALEKIDSIKYYLHRQQIEVLDFSEENRKYFDLMPGATRGTIRPALVADGAVLKKGLASTGK